MPEFENLAVIESPCVQNCCLDDDDICLGCFRSLNEITSWVTVDDATRQHYLENIIERKAAYLKKHPNT